MQNPRFDDAIAEYERQDRKRPPEKGGIVCTGSSIMRQWTTLAEDMAPMPVINRAFGGSQTWEVLQYMDRVVLPYQPRVILYYCGSNDLGNGRSGQQAFDGFREFTVRAAAALPDAMILYLSINRVLPKQSIWGELDKANDLASALCAGDSRLTFVDINPCLFDADGAMRDGFFREDHVHLYPPAYRAICRTVRPILSATWQRALGHQSGP
ncbi:MAG: GDSL-type esterase/lipase family protein [bacterium]|nr:GDSL-type esterase/lipase family protein [bacterium]